ncbi:MAG: aldehyde dehydrogenase family protein, partial [Spirochaetota bacterium]
MLDKRNFYINGEWVKPAKPRDFAVINPSNEETFAIISLGSKEDTNAEEEAARNAFETYKDSEVQSRLPINVS